MRWDFWLLGDDMDHVVENLARTPNRPTGLYTEGQNYRIWVRRWAEVLEENRQRLHFFREHLEYQPQDEAELEGMLSLSGEYKSGQSCSQRESGKRRGMNARSLHPIGEQRT